MLSKDFPVHAPQIPIGRGLAEIVDLVVASRGALLLTGPTGVGKSEFVRAQTRRLGIDLVVLNLATCEGPGELVGLPIIVDGKTVYAPPSWLPTGGRGILLLEEMTRMLPFVLAPLYELLTDRRIGEHRLPEGWVIVACANPEGRDYDVSSLDAAMRDRFVTVDVCADKVEWIHWAESHGVHEAIITIAREDGKLFESASPRTWNYVSECLLAADRIGASTRCVELLLAARLSSQELARLVMNYVVKTGGSSLGPAEVLSIYALDDSLPDRLREELRAGRTDLLDKLVFEVERVLATEDLVALRGMGAFDLESFNKLLRDLPGDFREALQRAFAENSHAAGLLDVDPAKAVVGYKSSRLPRWIRKWRAPALQHLLFVLVSRIVAYLHRLDALGKWEALRDYKSVRNNLRALIADVGQDHNQPLLDALKKLGFDGIDDLAKGVS